MPEDLLLCYNRGCGQKYKLEDNEPDSCSFHPGVPVFHDAYKGWSCCNKKCTDFTEFLNIKGCTTSFHSNEKPIEPEKPKVDKEKASEVVEVKPPPKPVQKLPRPPLDTPLILMKPEVAATLAQQVEELVIKGPSESKTDEGGIPLGTVCKHGGCKAEYTGPKANDSPCIHHPGVPVFHEGLKFWSCCTKRTTDFAAFLDQVGCCSGQHQWTDIAGANSKPLCRHDWYQTGTEVVVSIYAKKYSPSESKVLLSPVRAKIELIFPENGAKFEMDEELRGIIDPARSEVQFLSTKVELKLRKAEPVSWSNLSFPKPAVQKEEKPAVEVPKIADDDDDPVDLGDL